jgi:DNA polymerase-1
MAKTNEQREAALPKLMQTSTGVYTNGVFTMVKALLNLFKKQQPSHVAVAWDITRDTFRKEMYCQYKAHREEIRPELKSQFILMQELLTAMNIPQFMYQKYEADDIIGTLAKRFETTLPTYILTKDQDALQLVNDHCRLWLMTSKATDMYKELGIDTADLNIPDNVFEYTPCYIEAFYGVKKPSQIVDLKALQGDSSDNIPGVKGVGPKAALPLLYEYDTVEELYDTIDNLSKGEEKEFKEFLKELGIKRSPLAYLLKEDSDDGEIVGKEAALLSKKLATIVTDILELCEVKIDNLKLDINTEAMRAKFKELEFKSMLIEK